MNTHEGYSKKKLSNDNVLLAGGGEKSLADFLGGIRISSSKIQYKAADSAASWTDLITLVNTDENVKQTPKTDNVNRPLMMINGGTSTGTLTSTSMFSTGIYANASTKMITTSGFVKSGSSDSYVLLGGGGHKAVSDFAVTSHTHPFSQITDGTCTSTASGWSHVLNNSYGGSTKAQLYMCHGGGYGMHLRGYSTSASVYMLLIYNSSSEVFGVYGDGHSVFGGNVTATHFYEPSDMCLKHDISMISKSIRKFKYNSDDKLYYGFIAQELEELHPELVDNSGEYKTVNYNSAICYYIAELENKVQKLEDEINKLKNK